MKKIYLSIITIIILFSLIQIHKNIQEQKIITIIDHNLEKIKETTNPTSSNPFDYINNNYYEEIISIGSPAVPVIEEMHEEGKIDSFSGYLLALAIQKITNCDLYQIYDINWSNSDEFFEYWKTNNCNFYSQK